MSSRFNLTAELTIQAVNIRDVARTGTGSTAGAEQQKANDELEARRKEVLASLGDVSKGGKPAKMVKIK